MLDTLKAIGESLVLGLAVVVGLGYLANYLLEKIEHRRDK